MNIAIIGKGGREHALVKALMSRENKVIAIPGSDGIALEAKCFQDINTHNHKDVIRALLAECIELVVIGPEVELCNGLADDIRDAGIKVCGPSKEASQLEGSKLYAKKFMHEYGVATSNYSQAFSVADTLEKAQSYKPPYVLKVDGLAAGKGVFICADKTELEKAATKIFVDLSFGEAAQAFLEEYKQGHEVSYLVLTNGIDITPLPLCKDHKQLLDGDRGPNTGGMGVVAPIHLNDDLIKKIHQKIIKPTISGLQKRQLFYRGVLYFGVMVSDGEPYLLEYNVRFGDPETQAIMPLLDGEWSEVLRNVSEGNIPTLNWKSLYACCVILASEGYPVQATENKKINFTTTSSPALIHSGTQKKEGLWYASGGRVVNCVAVANKKEKATSAAYDLASNVSFEGMQFRKDIKFPQ